MCFSFFSCSENYIFGKFDAFCRRLEKIADMASTLESLTALQHMKVIPTNIYKYIYIYIYLYLHTYI